MNPAVKHMDPVMGIDIHLIQPPGPVPPIPVPHPFVGMVYDIADYIPVIGCTVMVNGMMRGQAGTACTATPPHIPIGGTFIPPPPGNEGELFMGSSTVLAEGEPFSYMALQVLTCQSVGMPPPPRPKKKSNVKSFVLPTSVVLPIPAGAPVLVGGAPTISLMGMAMKGAFAALGGLAKGLKKLKDIAKRKNLGKKLANKAKAAGENIRNAVKRIKCAITGHPVDIATGKVFTDAIDFELPGPIPLIWERVWFSTSVYHGAIGYGWHHNYDMALTFNPIDGDFEVKLEDGRKVFFPMLNVGEEIFERSEGITFFRDEKGYGLKEKAGLTYRFSRFNAQNRDLQQLGSVENEAGQQIAFSYNQLGHLNQITDSGGRVLDVHTTPEGQITSIHAPHPEQQGASFKIIEYRYDKYGDLREVVDALGHASSFDYENHLLTRETDRNGLSFYFKYDGQGHTARCIHTWGDKGIYNHKLKYYPDKNLTVVENSLGNRTYHYANNQGLVIKTSNANGYTSYKEYNQYNDLITEIDEAGLQTTYTYDERGNEVVVTGPAGESLQKEFVNDRLVKAIDEAGGEWVWNYNGQGLLTERIDSLGRKTQYKHTDGLLTGVTNPVGDETIVNYDSNNNLTGLISPDGTESQFGYDKMGNCVSVTDPKGNAQVRNFDLLGRITHIKEPDGNNRHLQYDPEGNVVRATDKHHDVLFEYAGMGRMVARIEAGTRVEFKYDTEEQLTGIKNEQGLAYQFQLDKMGDVVVESGFDGLTRKYLRDEAGKVTEVQRPGGLSTHYGYDLAGRVSLVQHSDGSKETYEYRPDGELIEANNDTISVQFERDILGRVTKEIQGGIEVSSEYDELGLRIKVSSSLGAKLNFTRNQMGDVETVSSSGEGQPWEAHFKRDMLGLELERDLPGGIKSRWNRDKLGRPIAHQITAGYTQISSKRYVWDANDRLKQIIDEQKGITKFDHDEFGNLAGATYSDGSVEFRMPDAVGNLFKKSDRSDRKYGPAGQLLEANGTHYDYDKEGNLIRKVALGGKTWTYEWNASGMLKRVVRPDETDVTFTYDALGRRVSKTYQGKTTRWVWDGNVPLHEWVETSRPPKGERIWQTIPETVHGNGQNSGVETAPANGPPAQEIPGELTTWVFEPETFSPMAKLQGEKQYSIITDYLGTPTAMFDQNGTKTWTADLSICGEIRNLEGERTACPFRYPGQYEDEETGLYYNRFRYFDPEMGGYVSQDPIGLMGGHQLYSYVSDITKKIDTFGQVGEEVDWGKYLEDELDVPKPKDMNRAHAHHIVFKNGHPNQKKILEKSKKILKLHNIDFLFGKENLIWAPNKNHSKKAAEKVLEALEKAHDGGKGTREAVVKALRRMGKKFADGTICH